MQLVRQCGQKNENRSPKFRPPEIRPIELYSPIRQHRQDEVFGNVAALSNHGVPHVNFVG